MRGINNRKASMAGTSLGTAWIQIKPTMKGMTSSIRSELAGVGESSGADVGNKFSTAFAAKLGIISGVAQQAFAKVSSVISEQMSDAITRFDTIERFPKVMEQMGYSAEVSSKAIAKLVAGVEEVPTPLNQVVSGTQQLVSVTRDVDKASDWVLAVSDAMLSNSASAEKAQIATYQFMQVLQKGRPVGDDWRSIMEAAPGVMLELAEAMGYTSAVMGGDFYTAFQKGQISVEDVMKTLVEMDKVGINGMQSLAERAKTSSAGIETSITTLKQTISNLIRTVFENGDITPYVESIGKKLSELAPTLIRGFTLGFLGVARALPAIIAPVVQSVIDLLPEILQGITSLVQAIVQNLPTITSMFIEAIPTLVNSVVMMLTSPESLAMITQGFIQLMLASIQAFPALLTALAQALPTIITNIVAFLTDPGTIAMIIDGSVQLFMGIVMAVPQIIGALFSAFGQLFSGLWTMLKERFGQFAADFGNFIGGVFKNAINGVITFVENFLNGPIDIINGFLDIINGAFGWLGVNIGKIDRIRLPRLYTGGIVEGVGTETSDSNLYALSKGEYVIRAAAAREIGYDNLNRMNETGEIVTGDNTVNIVINGYNKSPEELANIISRKIAFNQRGVLG